MACPYFYPTTRHDAELWPHRRRLPLGDGFAGKCMAPGHANVEPEDSELGSCCNLGYARECHRLPPERSADAVHFCVARDQDGLVTVSWVQVKDHADAGHGSLVFDRRSGSFSDAHPDENLQRMAECYVGAYLQRSNR